MRYILRTVLTLCIRWIVESLKVEEDWEDALEVASIIIVLDCLKS